LSKSTRNSKSGRPKRKYGGRNKREGRVLALTLTFFVVLVLGLYALYQLKNNISPDKTSPAVTTQKMSGLVKEADHIIAGAFFDLGISIKDIESKKIYKKEEGGVRWEYKDIRVHAPEGVGGKDIKDVFKKSFSGKNSFKREFRDSGDSLTAELKANGYKTHSIKFELRSRGTPPDKIAKAEKEAGAKKEPQQAQESIATPESDSGKEKPDHGAYKPRVAIIVDDIGMSKEPIDKLLELPAPVTFSVLPNLPYSKYAAEMARNKGWEVMLHLPMEPMESSGYTAADAGKDALLVGLPKEAVLAKLDKNLSSVPYIKGVNNHMGSKFMENEELMEVVLEEIKRRGLFFIDSLTSSGSVGYKTALSLGMKTGKRDVFLDNSSKEVSYVKSQIEKLVELSEKNGYAIGICHPYPGTVQALAETIPLIGSRVDLVPVSGVLTQGREVSER